MKRVTKLLIILLAIGALITPNMIAAPKQGFCQRFPTHPRCLPRPTPSLTPSPTPNLTFSPTPSPLITPNPTPTPTINPTPSPTPNPTSLPSPTVAPTVSPTIVACPSLQATINNAPNGSILDFTGCAYTVSSTVVVQNKTNLTIIGGTLNQTTKTEGFKLQNTAGVVLRDWILNGASTNPGAYEDANQWWHAVALYGPQSTTLRNLKINNWDGDGIYVANNGSIPTDDLTIDNIEIKNIGRMGIAVVHGRNIVATNMYFENMGFRPVDIEPDWGNYGFSQQTVNITLDGGTIRGWIRKDAASGTIYGTQWLYIGTPYSATSVAPTINTVTIKNYNIDVTSPTAPHWWIDISPNGYRINSITIENNTTPNPIYGNVANNVDTLIFRNNKFNNSGPILQANNCTNVTQIGNGP